MEAQKKYVEEILRRVPKMPEDQLAKVVSLMDKLEAKSLSYLEEINTVANRMELLQAELIQNDNPIIYPHELDNESPDAEHWLHEDEKTKKAENYRKAINKAWGLLKDSPSGSEAFIKRKQEEKNLDR